MCISKEIIENRINNFLGYGNINSKIWFFSIEEGTKGNLQALEERFRATRDKSILDCYTICSMSQNIWNFIEGIDQNYKKQNRF